MMDSAISDPGAETAVAARDDGARAQAARGLEFLGDVVLDVTVELGRTRLPLGRIVGLKRGAVLELNKGAGELLDIRVADRFIARGEALVVNDRFAVRLTEINETERARSTVREAANA